MWSRSRCRGRKDRSRFTHLFERFAIDVIRETATVRGAARKGHDYVTLVCDHAESTVVRVSDGRAMESLASYYRSLTREQLEGIVGVSMDMWEHYVQATLAQVPDARSKIIFDRFHIMKQMTHAVDLVRRAEARELRTLGDDRLARTRYLWLYSGGEPAREAP